jgi:uncharacterized RDD family membrane protein YckC
MFAESAELVRQRGSEKLSTRGNQLASQPSWKEEVNRRLAEHQSRKGLSVVEERAAHPGSLEVSDRAAKAAARVAARFSSAPSYAEMQAAEARAALREAEVATRAALEAQVAAQAALENLQRLTEEQTDYDEPAPQQRSESTCDSTYIEAMPAAPVYLSPEESPAVERPADAAVAAEKVPSALRSQAWDENLAAQRPQFVEAQPIHANLIHFPREIVATRRIRPRLAAGELSAEEQMGQLSIFEVDPSSISTEPAASIAEEVVPAPSWSGPEWTTFDLEPQRVRVDDFDGEPPSITSAIHLASLELRCMAAVVDLALIVALTCAGAAGMASHLPHGFPIRTAEIAGLAALVLIGVLYHSFFLMVTFSTPGMMYAGIGLCTFDNEYATRTQLRGRLGALLVSLLPVGVGMAWAIFDEDHLSWHDRISRTYLRRC